MGFGQMEACEDGHERKRNSSAFQHVGNRLHGLIYEIDVEQGSVEMLVKGDRECRGYRADRPDWFASDVLENIRHVQGEDDLILDDQHARLVPRRNGAHWEPPPATFPKVLTKVFGILGDEE